MTETIVRKNVFGMNYLVSSANMDREEFINYTGQPPGGDRDHLALSSI